MSYGGDGIYAASKLIHQEPAMKKYKIGKRLDTFSDCISLVQAKKNFYVNYKKNLSMGEKKIYKIIKNINSSFQILNLSISIFDLIYSCYFYNN